MNRFGLHYTVTTFGESHGEAIGGVIDGMPAGIAIDLEKSRRNSTGENRDSRKSSLRARKTTVCAYCPDCLKA